MSIMTKDMESKNDKKAKVEAIYGDETYTKRIFLSDLIMEATCEAVGFVKDGMEDKEHEEDVQWHIDAYMKAPFEELTEEELARATELVQFVFSLLAKAEAHPDREHPFVRELSEYLDYEE